MNQTKKYLLFGCMAAVLVTAGSFPTFAGDSELYGVSLDQEEQAKAPVALDITAVYGKTARLGSFVPLKIRLYGQSESAFQGTLTVSTLESDNNGTAEPYEYPGRSRFRLRRQRTWSSTSRWDRKTAGSI
ncbi:hypothetical protein DW954_00630 [Clostridium sp. AM45-5]|nr:hypothetical protein [Clostridium sp. AM45-5]RHS68646.1 hypothetical protein DW954_00630 [Clostridium sp. AM45-5]